MPSVQILASGYVKLSTPGDRLGLLGDPCVVRAWLASVCGLPLKRVKMYGFEMLAYTLARLDPSTLVSRCGRLHESCTLRIQTKSASSTQRSLTSRKARRPAAEELPAAGVFPSPMLSHEMNMVSTYRFETLNGPSMFSIVARLRFSRCPPTWPSTI